ncbi:glutathione S-transferase family protein [Dyella flagellata]|uniref:Glutathione S-transferase n=1 Tax=Dyella flagellata TaxID=1867833 RepID=A0ABQ5X838_9GAMM|nr:glutathione S-transferase family protein [Dyella flagellata]GLQ87301.1 glutathione S-transferase [Dyella flagellata]
MSSSPSTLQVYFSPYSPFVRKVLVCAAELGIIVERLASNANPVVRDATIVAHNPLGQVPTLLADEHDDALYDSRVICEYLDAPHGKLFPVAGHLRWRALREQALADGVIGAAVLMRYELVIRPEDRRYTPWFDGQHEKVVSGLDQFAEWAPEFGERVDIGTISVACALAYLDLRFPNEGWRSRSALADWYAHFSARASMQATRHPEA